MASTYLLELSQRRQKLLSDAVNELGIPSGSVEHKIATTFAARSVTHHDQLDAQANEVERTVCSVSEKLLMHGRSAEASKLLLLASRLSGKPMRLDGQRIVKPEAAALDPAPPLLEHPYAAISFLLALSGSRSSSAREEPFSELDKSAENSSQVFADGVDGKLADLAGDSSRLWSSDSEDEEKVGEGKKRDEPSHVEVGRWQLDGAMSSQNDGLDEDADTREWLQAFESEANSESDRSSAHTDDERFAADEGAVFLRSRETSSQVLAQQPPRSGVHRTQRTTSPKRPVLRHKYGARCFGADIRSLSGVASDCTGVKFVRPCQTLEAFQNALTARFSRRRSVPEACLVRDTLHMLQGLPGDTFVQMGKGDSGAGFESRMRRFCLSALAERDLAVASLSPVALFGALGEFVRVGNVAEYLRAFVADAEELPTAVATGTAGERKHGYVTQAFAACVRRHLEAFEEAVAQRDRWLYRRQRRLNNFHYSAGTVEGAASTNQHCLSDASERNGGGSGETLLGLLSLLQPEFESLEFIAREVEAGAGSWFTRTSDLGTRTGNNTGGLRERTGRLLSALHDSVVAGALLGRTVRDLPGFEAGARAPRRRGWLLHAFCEVLAPYLDLIDAWITEGRIQDPHGELFFSQTGGGGSVLKGSGKGSPESCGGGEYLDTDPVVHVWDTGIVIHSKALPHFLAPLASAVTLAGQDVSLMRKVRALVALRGDVFAGTPGATTRLKSRSSWIGPGLGRGVESLPLATQLFESLEKLAARVRLSKSRRNADDVESVLIDTGEAPRTVAVDPSATLFGVDGHSSSSGSSADSGSEEILAVYDGEDAARATGDSRVTSDTLKMTRQSVARRTETTRGYGENDEKKGGESLGEQDWNRSNVIDESTVDGPNGVAALTEEESKGHQSEQIAEAVVPDAFSFGRAEVGPSSRAATAMDASIIGMARGHASASLSLAGQRSVEVRAPGERAHSTDNRMNARNGIGVDHQGEGFFWGTAQLALTPDATLQRSLHLALAPPCLSISRGNASEALQGRASDAMPTDVDVGSKSLDDGKARHRDDDGLRDEKLSAKAADDVAAVLPPSVVLERCLLSPLREHCRLASSSCLGVFVQELGIIRLAGVMRGVYLSLSGAATRSPLFHFRKTLFRLLKSFPSRAEADTRGDGRAVAEFNGAVVRDVAAFLQDGPRLTSILLSSLTVEEMDEDAIHGAVEEESIGAICKRLRSPIVGGDRPLAEHFVVQSRPSMVREWRKGETEGSGGEGEAESIFPLTADGRFVDLRVFSCLQLQCRLPWPFSVALPPRSMDKYTRILGLILRLDFTVHVLEESHMLHRHEKRHQSIVAPEVRGLDRRHLLQTRLAAFLCVVKAVRRYVVRQASMMPWSEFIARVPRCGSLRSFIRLHEAYLDLIRERCFLLPHTRQTLAYLLDVLQAGVAFSKRYEEYVTGLKLTINSLRSSPGGDRAEETGMNARDSTRESLGSLDELWEIMLSALGFLIPLLKEMVRSRSGVHVKELLVDLDFNGFFETQKAWRVAHLPLRRSRRAPS